MTLKPVPTSGRFEVTSSIVIISSSTLRAEGTNIPYSTELTRTDLDVLQEKKIDDYWNVDPKKHLSDSWRRFTKFTLLKEVSKRIHVVQEKTDKDPNDNETRLCMARSMDEKLVENGQEQKTKLDTA